MDYSVLTLRMTPAKLAGLDLSPQTAYRDHDGEDVEADVIDDSIERSFDQAVHGPLTTSLAVQQTLRT